jgi:hypothetical protein
MHGGPVAEHELDVLLLTLARSSLRFVIIGGIAVGVHGYVRATRDLDICPDPADDNVAQLAKILRDLGARHAEAGDFGKNEMPFDPLNAEDLAAGGNFRLSTRLGALDLMQWVPGIDAEQAFAVLDADAVEVDYQGEPLRVCSLKHLRAMKETAGRPQDLLDLENLPPA